MSLKYFGRYRFNDISDLGAEDFGERDLAVESGSIESATDVLYGTTLEMDSSTSLLAMGTLDNVSGSLSRSFSFWAKNNTVSAMNPVFSYGDLEPDHAFVLYSSNSSGKCEFYDHTTSHIGTSDISVSTWYFYSVTYETSTSTLKLYVNGSEEVSINVTLDTGTADALRIGTDGIGNYFDGEILDMRMFETILDPSTVSYIYSTGPNFEEKLENPYVEKASLRGVSMAGPTMSKSTYGVQDSSNPLDNSYHIYDDNGDLQEAARVEYTQETSGTNMSVQVRHFDVASNEPVLLETISMNPTETTFTNADDDDSKKTIVFSSSGVNISSGAPGGIFFGSSKDFRMAVDDSKFVIQAYDSSVLDYVTKMEINS